MQSRPVEHADAVRAGGESGSLTVPAPSLSQPGARDDLPAWVADLVRYIDANVELPVSVSDLARVSGRSPEHVARRFRSLLNTTPSQAINASRVNRAALLLAHTNRDILDICFGLGYNSASYFYRLFRRRHGVPPHQYRREHSDLSATGRSQTGRACIGS